MTDNNSDMCGLCGKESKFMAVRDGVVINGREWDKMELCEQCTEMHDEYVSA